MSPTPSNSVSYSGSLGPVPGSVPVQETPVSEAMTSLEVCQNHTSELLATLERRLTTVLAPNDDKNDDKNGCGQARPIGASPLVDALYERTQAGASFNARLRGMLERLTV